MKEKIKQEYTRVFDQGTGSEHPSVEQMFIRQAIKYLTPKQRAVWEYYNYDQLTQDEIAEKLSITHQGVAKHIKAIEKRISKWCKSNMGAYELLKKDYLGLDKQDFWGQTVV